MRLATIRRPDGTTSAARLDGDDLVLLPYPDLVALLAEPGWREAAAAATGERVALADADLAPPVRPAKVVCVGLNYRSHIEEMGRPLPDHPTLFIKFPDTLTGPYDDLVVPEGRRPRSTGRSSSAWSIGRPARRRRRGRRRRPASPATPWSTTSRCGTGSGARTQWDQGKNFEASTPVGPFLVTGDELGDPEATERSTSRSPAGSTAQTMQTARTADLLFNPAAIVGLRVAVHDPPARRPHRHRHARRCRRRPRPQGVPRSGAGAGDGHRRDRRLPQPDGGGQGVKAEEVRAENRFYDEELLAEAELFDPARLHEAPDGEWSAAQVLAHLGEFPRFFAGELQRWRDDPAAVVGRTHEHPVRLAAVASPAEAMSELTAAMRSAFAELDRALNTLSDDERGTPRPRT